MKYLLSFLIGLFLLTNSYAQLKTEDIMNLQSMEELMKTPAVTILQGANAESRLASDSIFTRLLVQALRTNNSFYYPFDSLITISKLVPPDSSFRIFTWQLVINDNIVRKHGAIQMNTPDGSLKLFPLIDKTTAIENIKDTIADNLNWIGAIYYKIIETQSFGKKYYTLLGYDENDIRSNRKLIEVLSFEDGKPVFGGNHFSFPDSHPRQEGRSRYIMTYKKYSSPRLTYDPELDMIVIEHLISETGETDKEYTYIPDGDYEGMKWKDGKWVYIEKVFTYVTPEGQTPVPQPILDDKGKVDETKLKKNQ